MTAVRHQVTAEDLRRLATVDPGSLFRDADSLADTNEGISITPRGIRVYGGFRIGRYLRIGSGKRIVKF
jgi:hypothetical protein